MKNALFLALAAAIVLPFTARAQAKPDFTGTWTLDAAKSDAPMGRGGRGGAPGPVTVTQDANTLTQKRGEQTLVYKLDGSESSNEVQGRGGVQTVKSKAKWEGAKLVIESTREIQGFALTTKEERTLSADGKEMTIHTTATTPQGDIDNKQVYTKS
jgi:hypothetical protein